MGKTLKTRGEDGISASSHHPQSLRTQDDTYLVGRNDTGVELTLEKGDESPAKIILLYIYCTRIMVDLVRLVPVVPPLQHVLHKAPPQAPPGPPDRFPQALV